MADGCYFLHTGIHSEQTRKAFGGIILFQKKEVIYSGTIGVCVVEDIVRLADSKKEAYNYYLLRSVYDRTKKAYIPVENHTVQLRNLITLQEALALREAADFDERSEQERGEAAYVIEKAQAPKGKKQSRERKVSENSENIVQSD
jgi:hypothetical protein